jgi:hypothetical protein
VHGTRWRQQAEVDGLLKDRDEEENAAFANTPDQ